MIKIKCSEIDCGACASRALCLDPRRRTTYARRTLTIRPEAQYRALQATRESQETAAFATLYGQRAGIEGTISQGVRSCGLRRSRVAMSAVKTEPFGCAACHEGETHVSRYGAAKGGAGADEGPALVERARGGDLAAFGRLVERFRPAVVRTAWALLANHHDAEEVAQEALVQAWRWRNATSLGER